MRVRPECSGAPVLQVGDPPGLPVFGAAVYLPTVRHNPCVVARVVRSCAVPLPCLSPLLLPWVVVTTSVFGGLCGRGRFDFRVVLTGCQSVLRPVTGLPVAFAQGVGLGGGSGCSLPVGASLRGPGTSGYLGAYPSDVRPFDCRSWVGEG